jgi:malate dehydrogenase (oxaloacetate-decarboxylating)(NADP+)
VFASGSPFPPVTINGQTLHPGQGNNAYIFPGIALATILCDIRSITDDVFLESAKVSDQDNNTTNFVIGRYCLTLKATTLLNFITDVEGDFDSE